MPDNTISPTFVFGILGCMVLAVTILFMLLALNSIIAQPDWLYKLFRRQHADPVPRKRA